MNRNILTLSIATVLASASTLAAAFPASGEFSAADVSPSYTASNVTRAEVRQAAADHNHGVVNGETLARTASAQAPRTRAEVREEGRVAVQSGKMVFGELSM